MQIHRRSADVFVTQYRAPTSATSKRIWIEHKVNLLPVYASLQTAVQGVANRSQPMDLGAVPCAIRLSKTSNPSSKRFWNLLPLPL